MRRRSIYGGVLHYEPGNEAMTGGNTNEHTKFLESCAGSGRRKNKSLSFHVVSFMKIRDGRISALDEYWGDDGDAPQWRLEKKLGTRINRQL